MPQIWAGSKQRELRAGSMQLLHQYSPLASAMLAGLVLGLEPIGWRHPEAGTLLGAPLQPALSASGVLGGICCWGCMAEAPAPHG